MKVLAASSRAKGDGPNLDRVVVTEDWVVVLDGATPKSADLAAATSATAALVDDLVRAVRGAPGRLDPYDLIDRLADVAAGHRGTYEPSASGAVFSPTARKVVVVSDVWVALDGEARYYGHSYEQRMTDIRRAFTERELAAGRSVAELRREDPGRSAVIGLIAREAELRNVDAEGSSFFAALDGQAVPRRLLTEVDIPPTVRLLTLASDGYPVLEPNWEATEAALRRAIDADPLRIGPHGGTKAVAPGAESYDDRSFVQVQLS